VFRLIKFTFKALFMLKLMALAFGAGVGVAYALQLRAQYDSWGLPGGGDARALAGDELVPEADIVETRAIEIDVAPDEVWPWLVQLGYGRGGWYSYPMLDRPWSPSGGPTGSSAEAILEEHQELAEGDVVPTHRGGGFVVRVAEPAGALALYLDDAMVREQFEELAREAAVDADSATLDPDTPPYAVSWAFVLEDAPGGRARLIERIRVRMELDDNQRRFLPVASFGLFALMRSQMLGIKDRAEGAATANA
jgi:hypothetical protein